ncbi:MAG: glycosyltransferase family 2 protein [Candidatus Neomarinimicrobiota bacterium]
MTEVNTPKISVILPVYNGEEHLTECVESILHQSYTNFEFVIVDDASTDNTPQILKKYSNQDERVRVLTNPINQKQTISANTACKNTSGKYIARMDADDIALPMRFEKQLNFLEANPCVSMVGSWINTISDNGKIMGQWKTSTDSNILIWYLLFGTSFAHSSVMMRSDLVKKVDYYQSPEAEDYDLWSRLSRITKVANLPEVLQHRRVWAGQLALKVPTETRDCMLQIMQNNMQHLLNVSSINLKLVEIIRSVTEENQPKLDSELLKQSTSLINALYSTYILKTVLSKGEKKIVTIDALQKLYKLATWQYSLNPLKGFYHFLLIAIRNPKFVLIAQFLKVS